MERNFLTDKDFNLAIYAELTAAAVDVFNNYIICAPGQYSAADIAKELYIYTEKQRVTVIDKFTGLSREVEKEVIKERGFKPGKFQFKEGYNANDDRREIVVNSFSCVVTGFSVFDVLKRAAAAWNVPTSKKAVFIRETETAATVATVDSPAAATIKQLKNSTAADQLRPVMSYIFADIRRRCLVASDGQIMTVAAAPSLQVAATVANDDTKEGFLISPALLKNKTVLTIDANDMASNGAAADKLGAGRFPNWYAVLNGDYYEAAAVSFGQHWPEIKKVAAAFAKFTDLENKPVVIYGESYTNKLVLTAENYDGDTRRETIVLDDNFNFTFAFAVNGATLAKIERAEKMYISDACHAVVFTAPAVVSLIMPVLIPDNSFNDTPAAARAFVAPHDGARAAVLSIVDLGPAPAIVANDDTAAPAADIETPAAPAADIESTTANDDSQTARPRWKSLNDFSAQLSRINAIADTYRPARRDKNGETVIYCTCPYHYSLPIIRGDQKKYNEASDRAAAARRIVAAYRKNIETATGRDFWDVNEKFAPAIYRGLTTANDDTAAPAADIETRETAAAPAADIESTTANDDTANDGAPAVLVPADIETPAAVLSPVAFVDVCETAANDDTAAPGFAAAPVPVAAPLHFWHPANDDTRRPAVVLDIEADDTPANDDTAAHGQINAVFRYLLRAAAVVAALLLLTFANDRPTIATARPAAADIETRETPAAVPSIESTTANDGAPAVLVPVANDDTAAPAAADIESTTANDGAPRHRSTRPRRRAVRAAKVAAPAADIESTTARDTTANDDTARALLLTVATDTTANDTARAIVAAPTLYEAGEITETSDTAAAVVPAAAADIESTTANDDTQTAATVADIETSDTAAPSIESTTANDDTANDDTANDGAPATTGTTTTPAPAAGSPAAVATPCPPAAPVAPVAPIIL